MELGKRSSILFNFDEYAKEMQWDSPTQNLILRFLIQEAENFGPGVLQDRLEAFYHAEKERERGRFNRSGV
jgi:hypothetical protein